MKSPKHVQNSAENYNLIPNAKLVQNTCIEIMLITSH